VTPDTDAGKIFTIIYAIVACSLAAKGFRDVVCYPLVLRAKTNEAKILEQFGEGLSERSLKGILQADLLKRIPRFQQDQKSLYKSEFMLLLLRLMNKVQEKDIIFASEIFDRLDIQKDGKKKENQRQKERKNPATDCLNCFCRFSRFLSIRISQRNRSKRSNGESETKRQRKTGNFPTTTTPVSPFIDFLLFF
jgi:hypothetical protein